MGLHHHEVLSTDRNTKERNVLWSYCFPLEGSGTQRKRGNSGAGNPANFDARCSRQMSSCQTRLDPTQPRWPSDEGISWPDEPSNQAKNRRRLRISRTRLWHQRLVLKLCEGVACLSNGRERRLICYNLYEAGPAGAPSQPLESPWNPPPTPYFQSILCLAKFPETSGRPWHRLRRVLFCSGLFRPLLSCPSNVALLE